MKKTVDVVHVAAVVVVVVVVGSVAVVAVGLYETFSLWLDLDLQHAQITENLMDEVFRKEAME